MEAINRTKTKEKQTVENQEIKSERREQGGAMDLASRAMLRMRRPEGAEERRSL